MRFRDERRIQADVLEVVVEVLPPSAMLSLAALADAGRTSFP